MHARIGFDFGRFCQNKPRTHEGSLISRKSAVLAAYFNTTRSRTPSGGRVAVRGSFLHQVLSETPEKGKPRNLAAFWLFQCYTVKEGLVRGFGRGSFGRQSSSFGRTGREQNRNQGPFENTTPLYGGRGGVCRLPVCCFLFRSPFSEHGVGHA